MDGLNQSLGLYVIEAEKIIITENRTKGRDKERALNVLQKNPGELLLKILIKKLQKFGLLNFMFAIIVQTLFLHDRLYFQVCLRGNKVLNDI